MSPAAPISIETHAGRDIEPATVLAANGREVVVRLDGGGHATTAQLALSAPYAPRAGDRMLIARGSTGAWAIAVLSALRAAPAPIEAPDGCRAALEEGVLTVRDSGGRLLFEHRPDEGVSVVHAPHGDLRFAAPRGSIALSAARDVRIEGDARVRVEGREVQIGAEEENRLRFDRRGASLRTPELEASAATARVAMRDATFAVGTLTTAVDRARHVVGVAETHAGRLVSWVKNAYTEIEELSQTRAGRVRAIVREAYHLTAERALIKAEDDVAIKGERIDLG